MKQCAASISLEALFPDEDSDASREGDLAHAVAAAMFKADPIPADATEEMLDGAEMLFDHVSSIRSSLNKVATLRVEERVDCSEIHPQCWGTDDVDVLDVALNHLHVFDYKFGHSYVEVFENWQLLAYAIGRLKNYGSATTESIQVHLHIVQPRCFHPSGPIRTWTLFGSQLMGKYLPLLRARAAEAMSPEPVATTGGECRNCSARHTCTTLQTSAFEAFTLSGKAHPHQWEPGAMGRELALLKSAQDVLGARISGLENEVLARIKLGTPVAGWMTMQGMGREKWAKPIEEVLALGEMMGVDISKKGAITPKQAIKAGISAAVVSTYSETPHGEIKLVRDDTSLARKAFGV
jgi:hypothetical protein